MRREAARKLFHLLGLAVPIAYLYFERCVVNLALTLCFIASATLEGLRLYAPRLFPFKKIFRSFSRPEEEARPASYLYFFLGALLITVFLEKDVVITALAASIVGDVASALVGTWLGRMKIPRRERTVEGVLAGVLAIMVFSAVYPPCLVAAMAFIAVEFFGPPTIDDNLLHPLSMGITMQLYNLLFKTA